GGDINDVAVQVGSIGDCIADVEPDAEPDSQTGLLLTFVRGHTFLHRHGGTHRSIDTVEHGEQRVARGLDDPATTSIDRGIDHTIAQPPQPFEGPNVIDADQAAITDHVGIEHDDEPSASDCPFDQVSNTSYRHADGSSRWHLHDRPGRVYRAAGDSRA